MNLMFDSQNLRLSYSVKTKKQTPKSYWWLKNKQIKCHIFTKKVEFLKNFKCFSHEKIEHH